MLLNTNTGTMEKVDTFSSPCFVCNTHVGDQWNSRGKRWRGKVFLLKLDL